MNKAIKLLVCYHKKDILFNTDIILPIHVGASLSQEQIPIQRDDEGIHISEKNGSFCELTAMYWAWKNLKDVEIVGLFHYRRFFDTQRFSTWRNRLERVEPYTIQSKFEKANEYEKTLKEYDVILASPKYLSRSVIESYGKDHAKEDMAQVEAILKELYPEYLDAFHQVMNSHHFSPFNMFITRWPIFDDYCQWLFSILFKLESQLTVSDDPYQKRVFGFIAERLMSVYRVHHKLRIKYSPVLTLENNAKIRSNIRYQSKRLCTSLLRK